MALQLIKANALHLRLTQSKGRARLEVVPCTNGSWAVTSNVAYIRYILACSESDRVRTYPTMLGALRRALHSFSDVANIWVEPSNPINCCAVTPDSVA